MKDRSEENSTPSPVIPWPGGSSSSRTGEPVIVAAPATASATAPVSLLNVSSLNDIRVGQSLNLMLSPNRNVAVAVTGGSLTTVPATLCLPSIGGAAGRPAGAVNLTFVVPTSISASSLLSQAQPRRKRQQGESEEDDPKSKRRMVSEEPQIVEILDEEEKEKEREEEESGGDDPSTAYYCPQCSQWLYNRMEYKKHDCVVKAGLRSSTPESPETGLDPYTNMPRLKPAPILTSNTSDVSPPTPSSPGQAVRTSNSPMLTPVKETSRTVTPVAVMKVNGVSQGPADTQTEDRSASNSPFSVLDTSSPSARGSPAGRSYQCNICFKSFGYKGTLEQHFRTHTDARPFKCTTCGKAFRQKTHLTRHILIHSGERPYKCSECGKQFNQSNNLNQHMITHSGKKDFECPVCFKSFTLAGNRKKHIQRKHPVFYQTQLKLQKDDEDDEEQMGINLTIEDVKEAAEAMQAEAIQRKDNVEEEEDEEVETLEIVIPGDSTQ